MRRSLSIVGALAALGACWAIVSAPACSSSSSKGAPDATADVRCVPVDAGTPDPTQVVLGQALVKASKCYKCHGDTLTGNFDGVMSCCYGQVYPPNLTNDPATGLGCWTDPQIQTAILDGLDNMGSPLCPPMPHFGDAGIDAAGAASIVQYLRSLPAENSQVPDSPDCTGPGDAGPGDAGDAGEMDSGQDSGRRRDGGRPDSGEADSGKPKDTGADSAEADAGKQDAADGKSPVDAVADADADATEQ